MMVRGGVGKARYPLPAQLRFSILQRDGFRCRYCGRPGSAPGVVLHVDHVVAPRCPRGYERRQPAHRLRGLQPGQGHAGCGAGRTLMGASSGAVVRLVDSGAVGLVGRLADGGGRDD